MSFNSFIHKYDLKKATSNKNNYQVFPSIGLDNVNTYLRDAPFSSDVGIVKLYPFKGTDWISYNHGCKFGSYGCSPPQKLAKFILKRN